MTRHSESPVKPRKMRKPAKAPFFMRSVIREIRKGPSLPDAGPGICSLYLWRRAGKESLLKP